MTHRQKVLAVLVSALTLDILLGILYGYEEHIGTAHGLYCSLGNAVTEGACSAPTGGSFGYIINAVEFLLVVPLVAATFSLFTSMLTNDHVSSAMDKVHRRLEHHETHHGMEPWEDEDG